ncbi:guanylate-binding protein 1-like [Chanos chanos]|uniref:Guanylate-binding protein 1-like n=1 Tax=Chanos chanos TaxID=29144 RepID=A0A6J2WD40_CHACN|nr:guanylate-binding protein 1-like [Chanos chanos]
MATVKMQKPICLIDNDESGCMCVRREALEILEEITQPVVVVAIVGLYRIGKSFLMNRLAVKNDGFALGATIESKTNGIWMWCLPHPTKEGHTLALLDSEGLGDVEKGDTKHDTWIFCLAVLLSSTLVYNSMGTINNDALEKLHYVTKLIEDVKVKSGSKDDDQSTEFISFFPSLVWTVRDFTLKLELDGQPITADQYLDNVLKLKPGSSKETEQYNLPRYCLRNLFSPCKCFVFDCPASGEKMKQMEQLTDTDLDPKFVIQVEDFCNYIFTNAQAKIMREGLGMTGRMLGSLAETYVEAISSEQVPCLDNAVESLSQIQNKRAATEALDFYEREMKQKVQLPTETQEHLSEIHTDIQREAVEIFINCSFSDFKQIHQLELMRRMQSVYEEYCRDNVETSREMSKAAISRVFSSLQTELKNRYCMQPGGYTDYRSALERATEQYRSEKGHGLMSEEVLSEYLSEKEEIGHIILAADKSLTESQQETERLKTVTDEQQRRAEEEQSRIKKQQLKDQQRTYHENAEQLLKKLEKEQGITKQELERVLNVKMKEQRELLEEGFENRAKKMQREIDGLKENKSEVTAAWPSLRSMLEALEEVAKNFLPGIGRLALAVLIALVILDPNTAHPELILSEELTRVRFCEETKQQIPNDLERFDNHPCVVASEGFESGTHSWDPDIGKSKHWEQEKHT